MVSMDRSCLDHRYTPNAALESPFRAPSFPLIHERGYHSPSSSQDSHWKYADRRLMQEILPGVHIGPLSSARDTVTLDRCAITTLVAVRTPATMHFFKPRHPEKYRYESLDLVEGSLLSALPHFRPFIDSCLNRGERLLVYDETGNAKAALVVCSYLMETGPMSSQDAYAFVRSRRLSVNLNEHERYQLGEYEILLQARNSIVSHPYSRDDLNRTSRRRKHECDMDEEANNSMMGSERAASDHRGTTPFVDVVDDMTAEEGQELREASMGWQD